MLCKGRLIDEKSMWVGEARERSLWVVLVGTLTYWKDDSEDDLDNVASGCGRLWSTQLKDQSNDAIKQAGLAECREEVGWLLGIWTH